MQKDVVRRLRDWLIIEGILILFIEFSSSILMRGILLVMEQ